MSKQHQSFLHQWFDEVWNNEKEDAIDDLMHDNAIRHGLGSEFDEPAGIAGFKVFYNRFKKMFGDIHVKVEEVLKGEDCEVARCFVKGKHLKTGKHVSFTGTCWVKLQDGKITEAWNSFDFLDMYKQIGAFTNPSI